MARTTTQRTPRPRYAEFELAGQTKLFRQLGWTRRNGGWSHPRVPDSHAHVTGTRLRDLHVFDGETERHGPDALERLAAIGQASPYAVRKGDKIVLHPPLDGHLDVVRSLTCSDATLKVTQNHAEATNNTPAEFRVTSQESIPLSGPFMFDPATAIQTIRVQAVTLRRTNREPLLRVIGQLAETQTRFNATFRYRNGRWQPQNNDAQRVHHIFFRTKLLDTAVSTPILVARAPNDNRGISLARAQPTSNNRSLSPANERGRKN